jgi:hypothetical protein
MTIVSGFYFLQEIYSSSLFLPINQFSVKNLKWKQGAGSSYL